MTLDEAKRRVTLRTVPGHMVVLDEGKKDPETITIHTREGPEEREVFRPIRKGGEYHCGECGAKGIFGLKSRMPPRPDRPLPKHQKCSCGIYHKVPPRAKKEHAARAAEAYPNWPSFESTDDGDVVIVEGEKKHHTPKFVQHCVTAITQNKKDLDGSTRELPDGEKGSPFAICWAQYKKNKRSLAAKHSKGKHHTVKQYETALAKLRKESAHVPRERVVFEATQQKIDRSRIGFSPSE